MSQKHSKNRKKEKKKSPAEKRKDVLERIFNINMSMMCMLCDKKDCVNRFKCNAYKSSGEQFSEDFKEIDKVLDEEEQG